MQATEKAVLLHIKLLEDLVAEGRAFEGFSQKSILWADLDGGKWMCASISGEPFISL